MVDMGLNAPTVYVFNVQHIPGVASTTSAVSNHVMIM